MTAAARKLAPPAPARSHPALPPRDFAAAIEIIPTACGRIVERQADPERGNVHRYSFWEPVLSGSRYTDTRTGSDGRLWGRAATRRPVVALDDVGLIYHELAEQLRAMGVMRATVRELGRRAPSGGPGGIGEFIYSDRGDLMLFSDPARCAALATAQRGRRT